MGKEGSHCGWSMYCGSPSGEQKGGSTTRPLSMWPIFVFFLSLSMATLFQAMLEIPSGVLFRNISKVTDILGIQLPSLDPGALLSRIQTYTMELINMPNPPLPKDLNTYIGKIPAVQAIRLASTLVTLISQVEGLPLGSSPLSMTCAIFLVALEGQSAESMPSHRMLAKELASRVNVRKDLVLQHYNAILDVLANWMTDVPWLSSSHDPDNLRSKRRKTSHRHVVAMGIKEVVRFRVESAKVTAAVSLDASRYDSSDGDSPVSVGQKRKRIEQASEQPVSLRFFRPASRPTPLSQLDIASLSLLSPHHPLSTQKTIKPQKQPTSNQDGLANTIMTSSIFPADRRYTRLQLLASERGGEAFIQDDELFDVNEFDALFRSEEELVKLRTIYGWNDDSASDPPPPEFISPDDWNSIDMDFWAELGESESKLDGAKEKGVNNRTSDEQIIGEWREASPIDVLQLDEDGDLNFQSDW